ncbi:MAG: hypothetical protein JW910_07450 [Anaerolineae bacterium]|nr:hypothetical protein [Anaerolineae bacterium]
MSDQPEDFNDDAYEEHDEERVEAAKSRLASEAEAEQAGQSLERQIRGAIANWVGATPDDDWDTIGRMWEANARGRIAGLFDAKPAEDREDVTWDDIGHTMDRQLRKTVGGWAGANEEDDWDAVGGKIDTQIRASLGKVVGAKRAASAPQDEAEAVEAEAAPEAPAAPAPAAPATWDEIGANLERNIRSGVGSWVDAEPDASWDAIGEQFAQRVRKLFGTVKEEETGHDPFAAPTGESSTGTRKVRVEIETDDDEGGE